MTVAPGKRSIPIASIVCAGAGVVAVVGGVRLILSNGTGCASPCAGRHTAFAVLLIMWGVVAMASLLRGRVGLVAMIAAIVLPLAVAWRYFATVLIWLIVILGAVRVSKNDLAPYYRGRETVA